MTPTRPMTVLLARWSALAIADVPVGATLTPGARESGSLLRPPATEADLVATEARLGRRLPPSYRDFLLASDGAYGDHDGPTWTYAQNGWEAPPARTSHIGVGFLPSGDLHWLRDVDPVSAEIFADTETDVEDPDMRSPVTGDGHEPWPWTPMADGLLIATEKGPGTTCLVPVDGAEEWQVWNIHHSSAVAYLSFRSFLEHHVAELEPVLTVAQARLVIARARARDETATRRLTRIVAPDAVPLLVAELDGPFAYSAALSLGGIGTPEAIDALIRLDPPGVDEALLRAGGERARDHLAERGAVRHLSRLGDARAAPLAVAVIDGRDRSAGDIDRSDVWEAISALGRSNDPRNVEVLLRLRSEETEPQTALCVALALVGLGAPEGRSHLAELATSGGPNAARAAWLLARVEAGYVP